MTKEWNNLLTERLAALEADKARLEFVIKYDPAFWCGVDVTIYFAIEGEDAVRTVTAATHREAIDLAIAEVNK